MGEPVVSVIIPARVEKYLEKTIRNVLANARGAVEVLAVLDGWLPEPRIEIGDERAIFFHFPEAIGQRAAINYAARKACGRYMMKLDAHCAVDEGFDVKLAADCEYDWTVIPRMYNLDVETWLPKKHKRTDYMYIGLRPNGELRTEYYGGREFKRQHAKPALIDDTMSCMGPGFFLHKARFWDLGGCDEAHGGWGQQGVEVACKAWLSGGRLVVNKKTWFAHWFRGGGGPGFPYPIGGRAVASARAYSKDLWMGDKWPQATRKFSWLLERFKPPGWGTPEPVAAPGPAPASAAASSSASAPRLSVVIPSYKDPFLFKTIESILENFTGSYEIIPVIDGYKPERPLPVHPNVRPVVLERNVGMRDAINSGVRAARGEYLMRSDEHCMFAKGFDTAILDRIEDNWIVVPRRFFLDPYKWAVMADKGHVDYEKLVILDAPKPRKFSGVAWIERTRRRRKLTVDETMAFQGSCWVMARSWWEKVIGELQTEGYGPHYQDTTEMLFKTWRAGGKLMLNKGIWYAHKHRSFNRTHQYSVSKAIPEWLYALDTWKEDYEKVKARWGLTG